VEGGKLSNPAMESLDQVLARNLQAVKEETGLSEAEIAKRAKIGAGSAHRALVGQNVRLDTLQALAVWLKVPAWTLLIPGLDPGKPPVLMTDANVEAEIRRRVEKVLREMGGLIVDPEETRPDGSPVSVALPFGEATRVIKGSDKKAKGRTGQK